MQPCDCGMCKTENSWYTCTTHLRLGQRTCYSPFHLSRQPIYLPWRDETIEPFDWWICTNKDHRCSIDAHVWMRQGLGHFPLRLSCRPIHSLWKNETVQPFNGRLCKTKNHWHSVDPHIKHITRAFVHSLIACNKSQSQYWHPLLYFWVLSLASRS